MKYILFLFFTTGSAPITPEHHFGISAEFDGRAACEYALAELRKVRSYRVNGACAPKGPQAMRDEVRAEWEAKYPPEK